MAFAGEMSPAQTADNGANDKNHSKPGREVT
jgi:hypothetical protein